MCKNHLESKLGIPPIMFEFPPRTDPRYEQWCNEIERNDLLNKETESQTNYLCINHFQPNMYFYQDRLKLHDWAIPEALPAIMTREADDDLRGEMIPSSSSRSPYCSDHVRLSQNYFDCWKFIIFILLIFQTSSYNKKTTKESDNSNAIACCLCFSFSDCNIL